MWWASPDDWRPALGSLLDDADRRRLGTLRRRRDRERSAVAAVLARTLVADLAGTAPASIGLDRTCDGCGAPHGKPRVTGCEAPVELSISHSGDRVVVAVALGAPVGVDVEGGLRDATALDAVDALLCPAEARRLRALPAHARTAGLLTYWARKESVLKATGDGLRVPLSSFAVTGVREAPRLLAWPARADLVERATLTDLRPGSGYVASLTVLGDVTRVVESVASGRLASAVA